MMNCANFMFVFGLAKCAILPSTRRNGNENHRASHDVFSASNLFLNIEKVLQTESQPTTKAAHSFSRKAKQRRVNEQKLKPVWAWVTDGKCSCRAEGEKKKRFGRGWLSSSLGELVTSTTIYEPAIVIVHPISCPSLLPLLSLLINIIGSVLCGASYDRKLCIKGPTKREARDEFMLLRRFRKKVWRRNFHRNINKGWLGNIKLNYFVCMLLSSDDLWRQGMT